MITPRSIAFTLIAAAAWAGTLDARDAAKASVVITAPADGATLATPIVDVDVAWSSGEEKKNDNELVNSIELRINGQTIDSFPVPVPLREGTHRFSAVNLTPFVQANHPITIVARGRLGDKGNRHEDSDRVRVTIQAGGDTVAPTISALTPATGSFTSNPRPALSAQISDTGGSGVDPASVALRVDGVLAAAVVTPSAPNAAVAFTPAADLSEGSHTFTVDARDLAGNAATQASSSFIIDRTPPAVSISAPSSPFTNNPRPPLSAVVTDAGAGVNPSAVVVTLDGAPVSAVVNATTLAVSFTPPASLAAGLHLYQVSATDRAGNPSSVAQASVTIDLTPPLVVITAPSPGSATSDPRPPLAASLSDPGGAGVDPAAVQVTLDGVGVSAIATPSSASFVPSANLGPGPHTYTVRGTDLAGNVSPIASSTFTVSLVALTVTQPSIPDGGFTNAAQPVFSLTLTNPSGTGINPASLVVRLDGTAVNATVTVVDANTVTVSFTPPNALPSQSSHAVSINGLSGLGEVFATVSSSFTVDLIAPSISNLTPPDGTLTGNPKPSFGATVTDSGGSGVDPASFELVLNGVLIPQNQFLVTLQNADLATVAFTPGADLLAGTYTLSVHAKDRAGSPATPLSTTITLDPTAPQVSISAPVGSFATASVPFSAVVSDAMTGVASVQVLLNGIDVTASLIQAPGSLTPFGLPGSIGLSGTLTGQALGNIVAVSGTDLAGNTGSASSAFDVQSEPPPVSSGGIILTKVSGDGQSVRVAKATSPLVVRANWALGGEPVSRATLIFDVPQGMDTMSSIGALGRVTDESGLASLAYIPSMAGSNVITVTVAEDPAAAPVTFTIQSQVPSLGDVSVGGHCNPRFPSTTEYPGSALPRLFKFKVTDINGGGPLQGQVIVPRVISFEGKANPPNVGVFLPSLAVTGSDGTATFAFVIDRFVVPNRSAQPPGSFTMEFSLPLYLDSQGKPVAKTIDGTVLHPDDKPKDLGDTEIDFDDPAISGQSQIAVPGKRTDVALRGRFFAPGFTFGGGNIIFSILEGEGSFEPGPEGQSLGSLVDQSCGSIEKVMQCDGHPESGVASVYFRMAPGTTHALIKMEGFTDIFAIGPPEVHVVPGNTSNSSLVKDFLTPADFRSVSPTDLFKVQVWAPNDLQSVTVDVESRTTSDDALTVFSNDVAPVSASAVPASVVGSRIGYTVYETEAFAGFPERFIFNDSVPSVAQRTLQISDRGQGKFLATMMPKAELGQPPPQATVVEHKIRVAADVQPSDADNKSPKCPFIFIVDDLGKKKIRFIVPGLQNSKDVVSVRYDFGDGSATVTKPKAEPAQNEYSLANDDASLRRKRFTITAEVLNDKGQVVQTITRGVNVALFGDPGGHPAPGANAAQNQLYQAEMDKFLWNKNEILSTQAPDRFRGVYTPDAINLASDPFYDPYKFGPDLLSNQLNNFGIDKLLPAPPAGQQPDLVNHRYLFKTSIESSDALEMVISDLRNYRPMVALATKRAWSHGTPELLAVERHEAKHVTDLFNMNKNVDTPTSKGAVFRGVTEFYIAKSGATQDIGTANEAIPVTAANTDKYNKLAWTFDSGNAPAGQNNGKYTKVPHNLIEIQPWVNVYLSGATDARVSHRFIHSTFKAPFIGYWNLVLKQLKEDLNSAVPEPPKLVPAKAFLTEMYNQMTQKGGNNVQEQFPELRDALEFNQDVKMVEPNFKK